MEWFKNLLNFNKKGEISSVVEEEYVITITANNDEVLADVNIYKDKIERIVLRMLQGNSNSTTDISNEIFMRLQIKHLIRVIKKGRSVEINFMGEAEDNKLYNVNINANDPEIKKVVFAKKDEITQITLELLEKNIVASDLACKLILMLGLPYSIGASIDDRTKTVYISFR